MSYNFVLHIKDGNVLRKRLFQTHSNSTQDVEDMKAEGVVWIIRKKGSKRQEKMRDSNLLLMGTKI